MRDSSCCPNHRLDSKGLDFSSSVCYTKIVKSIVETHRFVYAINSENSFGIVTQVTYIGIHEISKLQ